MANSKDITKKFLRTLQKGYMVPFPGISQDERNLLRVHCNQLKAEGFNLEVRYNPPSDVTIVRRKRPGEV